MLTLCIIFMFTVAYCDSAQEANSAEDQSEEYCINTDGFQAQCLKNEVIVMQRARYGRMKIGKCLQDEGIQLLSALGNDPLFLGCSVNILDVMDKKCSGRNQCEIRGLMDTDLRKIKPCHAALQLYMAASYYCASVVQEDRSCKVSLSHGSPEHIVSGITASTCGTSDQPWIIEASAGGQQIKISLFRFDPGSIPASCTPYGYITEEPERFDIPCNKENAREKLIYTSSKSLIKIVIFQGDSMKYQSYNESKILLKLEVTGCPNIIPPTNAWLRRSNHEAVIGCYTSRKTWHLHCVNNQWIGVYGNCSLDIAAVQSEKISVIPLRENRNEVIVIVCIASMCLIICLSIIVVGAVCLRKHYAMVARKTYMYYPEKEAFKNGNKNGNRDNTLAAQALHA